MNTSLIRLACTRGTDTFGLTILARNVRHALVLAKRLLAESGYTAHPLPSKG